MSKALVAIDSILEYRDDVDSLNYMLIAEGLDALELSKSEITRLTADLAAETARADMWQDRYVACVNKLSTIEAARETK